MTAMVSAAAGILAIVWCAAIFLFIFWLFPQHWMLFVDASKAKMILNSAGYV